MNSMNEIFVYPEDFIFPEDRSVTTGGGRSTSEADLSMDAQQDAHDPHTLLLPEEPPLVPPSLFADDSDAGIEFRSSFLFQSSCYLPDDDEDSESDCSPVGRGPHESQSRLDDDEEIENGEATPKEKTNGGAGQTNESVSSDDNAVNRRSTRRYERRTKTWKDPRHHHIEFRNDVSVSDVTFKADPSWRGYKIYVPGQHNQNNNSLGGGTGGNGVGDARDNYTVAAALTRAGMSTLSYEADFFTFVFPQTRKHQWACATIIAALVAASSIVGVTCGIGLCQVPDRPSAPIVPPVEASPPDSSLEMSPNIFEAVPTSSPVSFIATAAPKSGTRRFESTIELYRAVDDYLIDPSVDSIVAVEYGYPIGAWDIRQVTNLSRVFDAGRNPMAAGFNGALDRWNTSNVTTMEGMFSGAKAFIGNISKWDVSRVETMEGMFEHAHSFNTHLSGWNTESVVNMDRMFYNCLSFEGSGLESWNTTSVESLTRTFMNTPKFKGDLSTWDVGRVTSLKGIFRQSLSFNSDLSQWDVGNVVDLSEMFMHAVMFNSDISAWNTSSVKDFSCTLFGASSFNADISRFDLRNGGNFTKMIAGASLFNQDLCSWRQSVPFENNVETTSMFLSTSCPSRVDPVSSQWVSSSFCYDCIPNTPGIDEQTALPSGGERSDDPDESPQAQSPGEAFLVFADGNELRNAVDEYLADQTSAVAVAYKYGSPIGSWNVSQVRDFSFLFDARRNSATIGFDEDLNEWDTSSAVTMERMFAGASRFRGNVSTWNTTNVKNMEGMFTGADLFNGDLFWDTGSVKTMESMFHSAMSFTGRGLMNWKTSSVATVKSMFAEAGSFNADISAWDVGNVKDMTEAFFFASNFNSNLNLWNVSKVESLNSTFHGASSFNRDLSLWDVQNTVSFEGMFTGARGFNQNLCAWGPRLNTSTDLVLSGMFVASGCLNTDNPDAQDPSAGPLCRSCYQVDDDA